MCNTQLNCVHSVKLRDRIRMRNLINRLDAICHPFPGIHVFGLVGSLFFVGALIAWPTVGKTVNRTGKTMPIPALSMVKERIGNQAGSTPKFETRIERVNDGDSLSRLFARQRLARTFKRESHWSRGQFIRTPIRRDFLPRSTRRTARVPR